VSDVNATKQTKRSNISFLAEVQAEHVAPRRTIPRFHKKSNSGAGHQFFSRRKGLSNYWWSYV